MTLDENCTRFVMALQLMFFLVACILERTQLLFGSYFVSKVLNAIADT